MIRYQENLTCLIYQCVTVINFLNNIFNFCGRKKIKWFCGWQCSINGYITPEMKLIMLHSNEFCSTSLFCLRSMCLGFLWNFLMCGWLNFIGKCEAFLYRLQIIQSFLWEILNFFLVKSFFFYLNLYYRNSKS